jgi:hypothetical protein
MRSITSITYAVVLSFLLLSYTLPAEDVIIDAQMTFEEAIAGTNAPQDVTEQLTLVDVEYYSFDGKLHRGQLVINKALAEDIKAIFSKIKKNKFPIEKVIPIVRYGWDDDSSMADNNTSSFCYRNVAGTNRPSNHALARAIDFNPMQNPHIAQNGKHSPKNSKYNKNAKGTIDADCFITKFLLERGWEWGGNYKSIKDYQHFDKKNDD